MDNQNNLQGDLPPENTSQPETNLPTNVPQPLEQSGPMVASPPPQLIDATVFESPKKSGKKVALVLVVLLLLAAGAAAAWWFLLRESQNSPAANTTTKTPAVKKELAPARIVYAEKIAQNADDDCNKTSQSINIASLEGGAPVVALKTAQATAASMGTVYREKSAYILSQCSGKEPESIWYSSDSGKSYEKIYTLTKKATDDQFSGTVTSMKFSDDGKSLVFAEYSMGQTAKNTVKEIDPSTKKTTDLLSFDGAAFVQAYAREKKQLYYYKGCYFCDGNTYSSLLRYDVSNGKSESVFEQKGKIGMDTRFSSNLGSLIYVAGVAGDGLGGGGPYTTYRYSTADNIGKEVVAAQAAEPQAGYTQEGLIYYVKGKGVYTLTDAGKESLVFQADQPITSVLLVSSKQVVVATGTEEKYTLSNYDIASKKTNKILDGSLKTSLFGVAWE